MYGNKKICPDCKKREAQVDLDKEKDIDQLKIFLRQKNTAIRYFHFEKGFSLQQIFHEIQDKYGKRVCYGKWMTEKNVKHLFEPMKPKLRDFVLYDILKYSSWEEYKKNLHKLSSLARHKYGFTNKLKQEIKNRDSNTCQECGKTDDLEVHHIDGNRLNNDPENLLTLCKKCHRKYF